MLLLKSREVLFSCAKDPKRLRIAHKGSRLALSRSICYGKFVGFSRSGNHMGLSAASYGHIFSNC